MAVSKGAIAAAVGGLAALALASGSSRSSGSGGTTATGAPTPAPGGASGGGTVPPSGGGAGSSRVTAAPSTYAAAKLAKLRPRFDGTLGAALGQMVPASPFAGAPLSAVVGFTAIGDATEDTCSAARWRTRAGSFHEIGEFQTPAGPCSGPAPNPDRDAAMNHWGQLATSSMVRELLGGRDAVMTVGAWRLNSSVRDRAAIGLADLYRGLVDLEGRIPVELMPRTGGSLWSLALAFAAFSAGAAGAAQALAPVEDELARVEESQRFARWPAALVELHQAGRRWGPANEHPNPAYTCARTWQKLQAGKVLADAVGEQSASWYVLPSPALERELVAAAQGT